MKDYRMDKRSTPSGAVVGSRYKTEVGSIFLDILLFIMIVKPTTTTSKGVI